MGLEEGNRKWLLVLRDWMEAYKEDETNFFDQKNIDGSSKGNLLTEFKEKKDELLHHVQALCTWLSTYGMQEAMKQMPTVGKVLSLLCKLPFVVACDTFSTVIIDCMLHLSDFFSTKNASTDTNKRAKYWAVENFTSLCGFKTLDGVDLFLMDEFGVSQQEYMSQHLKSLIDEFGQSVCCKYCHKNEDDKEEENKKKTEIMGIDTDVNHNGLPKMMKDYVALINDQTVIPLVETLINLDYKLFLKRGFMDSIVFINELKDWLLGTPLFLELQIDVLAKLFTMEFEFYERYIVSIIEKCLQHYPFMCTQTIESVLREYKMIDLLRGCDLKFFKGFLHIVKDVAVAIGDHPGLLLLLKVVMREYRNYEQILFNHVELGDTSDSEVIDSFKWVSSMSSLLQQLYFDVDDDKNEETEQSRKRRCFELWYQAAQRHEEHLEEIMISIFRRKCPDIHASIQTLLWFFYPMNYVEVSLCTLSLATYVKALRNLASKKLVQLTDIQYLFGNLKRKLTADVSTILIVIHVSFCFICVGAQQFVDCILTMVFDVVSSNDRAESTNHAIFWFLTAIESSARKVKNISQSTSLCMKNWLSENIKLKITSKYDQKNPDQKEADQTEMDQKEVDQAETDLIKTNKEYLANVYRYLTQRIDEITIAI